MHPEIYSEVNLKLRAAATLLVEAALLQARAEAPGESASYYFDLLTDGDCLLDEGFEGLFWAHVADQAEEQLGRR